MQRVVNPSLGQKRQLFSSKRQVKPRHEDKCIRVGEVDQGDYHLEVVIGLEAVKVKDRL